MNYIQYGLEFFHGNSSRWGTNGLFMNGQVEQMIALFGNELAADSLTFVVNSKALVGDGTGYAFLLDSDLKPLQTSDGKWLVVKQTYTDWRDFVPGAALDLYNNPGGTMIGRFYVQDVKRVNRKAVQFTCTDCVGILDGMNDHGGGVYTGETVAAICAEIFAGSGLSYNVSQDVAAVQCYGRLARANRRVNMGKLLVATGATLTEKNGVVQITYLGAGTPSAMYQRNVYMHGGSVTNKDRATGVEVTEHAFYQLATDADAVLFDNTTEVTPAVSQLVVFQEACHDLTVTGTLTLEESNANYAIVSGVGTLSGKIYTHTQRQISKSTGVTSHKVKVEKIEDNELIGYHNSDYVAQRMANWYKVEIGVGMEALDPTGAMMPGTYVNLVDPFGEARTGWTRHKSFAIGNKTRATWDVAIDWQPGPWGSNLDAWELITESKTWTVPAGVTNITVQMVGGGQAGFDGTAGYSGSAGSSDQYSGTGKGGEGGKKGVGGQPGKANSVTVPVTPGDVVTVTIGTGGQSDGEEGTATTIAVNGTTYTSEDGVIPASGIVNVWTGDIYALAGPDGVDGAKGGDKGNVGSAVLPWAGGWYGNDYSYKFSAGTATGTGGGGGGAAHGAHGGNGGTASASCRRWHNGSCLCATADGGNGGRGANAVTDPYDVELAGGGAGGNGGGGGGGGGDGGGPVGDTGGLSIHSLRGYGGYGGLGSAGTPGGNGLALFMYKAAA